MLQILCKMLTKIHSTLKDLLDDIYLNQIKQFHQPFSQLTQFATANIFCIFVKIYITQLQTLWFSISCFCSKLTIRQKLKYFLFYETINNNKMDIPNSKTEQLINKNSYRKHRERLFEIRNHSDSNQVHHHQPMPLIKNLKANHQNAQDQTGNGKGGIRGEQFVTTQQLKQSERYQEIDGQCRFDVEDDISQGKPVRCVLPAPRNRAYSFLPTNKNSVNFGQKRASLTRNFQSFKRSGKRFQSFNMTRENERNEQIKAKEQQMLYNLPQRNQNRQVIHKKTIILSSTQSCLLQLCTIGDKLLIAAYIMGLQCYTVRQLLSSVKSKQLLKQYQNNYDQLCDRVKLQNVGNRYVGLKVGEKEVSVGKITEKESIQSKSKVKIALQNQFIQRNYYTLLKQQKSQTKEQGSISFEKEKKNISVEKVQALIDRLAAPRKYLEEPYYRQSLTVHSKNNQSKQSIPFVPVQPKLPLPIKKKETFKDKSANIQERKDKSIIYKREEKLQQKQKSESNSLIKSMTKEKQQKIVQKAQEEQVQYLEGDQYQDDQFQNPSGVNLQQSNTNKNTNANNTNTNNINNTNTYTNNKNNTNLNNMNSNKPAKTGQQNEDNRQIKNEQLVKKQEQNYDQYQQQYQLQESNIKKQKDQKNDKNQQLQQKAVQQNYEQQFQN